MVSRKKILCHICNKKCLGNVLRYQDRYYHTQCFENDPSNDIQQSDNDQHVDSGSSNLNTDLNEINSSKSVSGSLSHLKNPKSAGTDSNENAGNDFSIKNDRNLLNRKSLPMNSIESTNQISHDQTHRINRISTDVSDSISISTSYSSKKKAKNMPTDDNYNQHNRSYKNLTQENNNKASNLSSDRASTHHESPISSKKANFSTRSATLPHSSSSPATGGFRNSPQTRVSQCAGCGLKIETGQALIALDNHWHIWCLKCNKCQAPLHGEYVAKDGKPYCEKDYQKLFGVVCVYCKRYITGKVLQAGEAHHFHPSCARCSKCGDPFVPGEEMYLQGEVTWHPRCGPGPDSVSAIEDLDLDHSSRLQLPDNNTRAKSPSLSSRSRSVSPFSYMSRQYGRSNSPYGYADSDAVGDLSRIYTISYLNADPSQGYLRRPIEPHPPKSPQFSRPTSMSCDRSRSSSRSRINLMNRDRSIPRGMYSLLSGIRGNSSTRARSPSMMNEEAIQLAQYPGAKKPNPDCVPKIERDDFPAPPFPYTDRNGIRVDQSSIAEGPQESVDNPEFVDDHSIDQRSHSSQVRSSRPRSRELVSPQDRRKNNDHDSMDDCSPERELQFKKEEEELSKIASGIGKIFLQTLKEREKIRAWKRVNLDPRNSSRTPSATRELPRSLRYDNPTNASPSRDLDRPRPWEEDDGDRSPTRTRSSLGRPSHISSSSHGYRIVQSNRSTPKPGYGIQRGNHTNTLEPNLDHDAVQNNLQPSPGYVEMASLARGNRNLKSNTHLYKSMPNVNMHHNHTHEPPKLYPYHLLVTSNYRLPPDVDRCHLERHLSNEEFQYIFNCDRLDFYRLPEWRRNELKRRAILF